MKHFSILKRSIWAAGAVVGVVAAASTGAASALVTTGPVATNETSVQTIISRGDAEIGRRLATLNGLASRINATTKLSASDKTALLGEVNAEISGLTTLKTKLDADTTLTAARTDAKSIVDDYRVYALIVPKVRLVSAADGQQNAEAKLTQLIAKFQTRLNAAKSQGKNVDALEATLADMQSKTAASSAISPSVEQKVAPLQPTDYNNDHSILSGYRTQLQTAHTDNVAAAADAESIVAGLKNL